MRIDLNKNAKVIREIKKGSSKKFEVLMDGKTFFFKSNYNKNHSEGKKKYLTENDFKEDVSELNGDIIEVFSCFFLKKLGCKNCVEYKFATLDGDNGCVSQSFLDKNVLAEKNFLEILSLVKAQGEDPEDVSFDKLYCNDELFLNFSNLTPNPNVQYLFSVDSICEKLKTYCEKYNFTMDAAKIKDELSKIVIYDFFMGNWDRNSQNLTFLIKKNEPPELVLAPIFDNGESFCMEDFSRLPQKRHFLVDVEIGLTENGRMSDFEGNKYFENQKLIAVDIKKLAEKNLEIRKLVDKCTGLNINKMIEEFENTYDIVLPDAYKEVIIHSYNLQLEKYNFANLKLEKRLNKSQNKFEK